MTETGSGIELSDREREILRLVATGASNKDIARQLTISPNTVKVHLRNIFAKIGSASRTEATLYAIRAGLAAVPGTASGSVDTAGPAPEAVPGAALSSNGQETAASSLNAPAIEKTRPTIASGKAGWRAWRYAIGLGAVAITLALASL